MRSKRSPFIRLAVEKDLTVFVQAYTNTDRNNIRIRFDEGGFIPDGVFRYVMRAMDNPSIVQRDDPKTRNLGSGKIMFLRGPVTIVGRYDKGDISMDVIVRLPDGSGDVRKTLTSQVCDEIGVPGHCERCGGARPTLDRDERIEHLRLLVIGIVRVGHVVARVGIHSKRQPIAR